MPILEQLPQTDVPDANQADSAEIMPVVTSNAGGAHEPHAVTWSEASDADLAVHVDKAFQIIQDPNATDEQWNTALRVWEQSREEQARRTGNASLLLANTALEAAPEAESSQSAPVDTVNTAQQDEAELDWLDVSQLDEPGQLSEDGTILSREDVLAPEHAELDGSGRFGPRAVIRGIKRWAARRKATAATPEVTLVADNGPARTMAEILAAHEEQAANPEQPRPSLAERHPDWPKIRAIMYFSAHVTAEDLAELTQIADQEKPQIYLYEDARGYDYAGGKSHDTRDLQALADRGRFNFRGENAKALTARNKFEGTAWEAIYTMLEGRGVAVGSTDTTVDEEQELGVLDAFAGISQRPIAENMDDELQSVALGAQRAVDAQRKRDIVNMQRFEDELERIFKERPELKNQESITVLESFGAAHTDLAHALDRDGVRVDMRFQGTALGVGSEAGVNPVHIYTYRDQLLRTLAADRQPSHALLEKVCITDYLGIALNSVHMDSSYDQSDYVRRITDTLSADDLRAMHNSLLSSPTPEEFRTLIDGLLANHDAPPLARTADEMNGELVRMRTEQPTTADTYRAHRSARPASADSLTK